MLKNLFFLLLLLSLSGVLLAQPDFQKGYIVTNSNDTLFGQIDFRNVVRNSLLCSFKRDNNDSVRVYYPKDIKEYRIIDSKYYISKVVPTKEGDKNLFLEYLIKGQANIYYYRDENKEHYLIEKKGETLREIPFEMAEIVVNYDKRQVPTTTHIGLLKTLLNDCPELSKEIESIKKPGYDNLIALAQDYHHFICKNDSCIVYSKKKNPFIVIVDPTIGINRLHGFDGLNREVGLIIHIWIPDISERMYFNMGMFFYTAKIDNRIFNFRRIPVQVDYLLPSKGKIQFKLNYGFNFSTEKTTDYKGIGYFPTFGVGLQYKMFNHLYLSSNLSLGWTPFLWTIVEQEKPEWVSYSAAIGLNIKF